MKSKKSIKLKKIIFTNEEIIIKRKNKNLIIPISNIKDIRYTKKTFLNYILIYGLAVSPGWLYIRFINKIGWRKGIAIKIKYSDLEKIPEKVFSKIYIS